MIVPLLGSISVRMEPSLFNKRTSLSFNCFYTREIEHFDAVFHSKMEGGRGQCTFCADQILMRMKSNAVVDIGMIQKDRVLAGPSRCSFNMPFYYSPFF